MPAILSSRHLERSDAVVPETASTAQRSAFVLAADRLADDLFEQNRLLPARTLPTGNLQRLHAYGFYTAPLPVRFGGLGLGTEPGGHRPLLRCLAAVGGADLALGRLYEGHVNALILIHAFGSEAQLARAAQDAAAGKLFGVWNTGDRTPMRLEADGHSFLLQGCKAFATGAGHVERPVVTAEGKGWQMTLPRMDDPAVANSLHIDRDSWHPLGMEASESYTVDFTGARLEPEDLFGAPGDFYRDPLFRGGSIRFAAVQTGALLRLASAVTAWLTSLKRTDDPYQLARRGEIELLAQTAALWIDHAADLAEVALWPQPLDAACVARMVQAGHSTRLAVERAGTAVMPLVIASVGAHGLLQPAPFERILRDLTMYLRQPSPDATLAETGRSALTTVPDPWRPL